MALRGPVLASMNLSDADEPALRQAHEIASGIGAPLVVCHVLPEAFQVRVLFPQDAGVDTSVQAQLEPKARTVVAARIAEILGKTDESIAIEIESGTVHAGILEVADRVGAGLIVVGPGSTALQVARSALCPVLIARPSPADGPIVAATDFSDPALPAVQLAAAESVRRKVALRVVHSLETDETTALAAASIGGMIPMPPVPDTVLRQLESEARARIADALAHAGAEGEALVIHQRPAAGIVETAGAPPASLVVVGTRGRTGFSRLMLGSVAEEVVSHAPCSVLVAPLEARGEKAGR